MAWAAPRACRRSATLRVETVTHQGCEKCYLSAVGVPAGCLTSVSGLLLGLPQGTPVSGRSTAVVSPAHAWAPLALATMEIRAWGANRLSAAPGSSSLLTARPHAGPTGVPSVSSRCSSLVGSDPPMRRSCRHQWFVVDRFGQSLPMRDAAARTVSDHATHARRRERVCWLAPRQRCCAPCVVRCRVPRL